jgi:hypothetical protein
MPKLDQQGFLTIAQNTNVNYLQLAYLQAMSIKLTMPNAKYAVLVDAATNTTVTDKHRAVFDYIIEFPEDHAATEPWKLGNEWQVFNLTPFKETIKVESDLLFTRSIDHWWNAFRLRDVVLSLGCRDYQGNLSNSRRYRRIFDDNHLPDVYNGLMYFRYSQTAYNFFNKAKNIFENWDSIKDQVLLNCRDNKPTTDVVYAITAAIIGVDRCTLPGCDFINFTHMKNAINNWPESVSWTELALTELELPMIRINNVNQYHPVHYHDKTWASDEVIKEYEREFFR